MEKNEPTQSKYDAALAKYNTQLDDAEIAAQAARIIAEKVPANNTPEVKKFLFNCIDLTTLKSEDSDESVMKFTQKVNKFDEEFPDLKFMKEQGILKDLEAQGIEDGDTVRMYGFEFDYYK